MKIHLSTFFVRFSLAGFSVPTTVFSINRVQILLVLSDKGSAKFNCPTVTFSCPGQSDNPWCPSLNIKHHQYQGGKGC